MAQSFVDEYMNIPPVTRAYSTACVLTTLAVQLELTTPFQLYYNPNLVINNGQLWRLVTTFLFFGPFGFSFLFNMLFLYRYCRNLEEDSFRGRTADFVVMFLFGGVCMLVSGLLVNMIFLGQAFIIMLVYVWSRRNPYVHLNFLGLLNFQAPYLPWVLLAFSVMFGNSIAVDVMGIVVGHLYFFIEDVLPAQIGGVRLLRVPQQLTRNVQSRAEPNDAGRETPPPPEEQPGGFDWGPQAQN